MQFNGAEVPQSLAATHIAAPGRYRDAMQRPAATVDSDVQFEAADGWTSTISLRDVLYVVTWSDVPEGDGLTEASGRPIPPAVADLALTVALIRWRIHHPSETSKALARKIGVALPGADHAAA